MTANDDPTPHDARAQHFRARGITPQPADPVLIERTDELRAAHPARVAYFRNRIRSARNAPTRTTRTRSGLFATDELLRDWQARR